MREGSFSREPATCFCVFETAERRIEDMQQSFPGKARQGPPCPRCGGDTLLLSEHPDTFECLDCGKTEEAPKDGLDYRKEDN
jgi:ribosomal protein S27AE